MVSGTVKVRVRYLAVLRELTGRREEEVEVKEGATVGQVIELLTAKYGEKFGRYILSGRRYRGIKVLFFVDGRNVEGLGAQLREGCLLTLLPPIAGGG